MKSRRTKDFKKLFARLPKRVQKDAEEAYALFSKDPSIIVLYNSNALMTKILSTQLVSVCTTVPWDGMRMGLFAGTG